MDACYGTDAQPFAQLIESYADRLAGPLESKERRSCCLREGLPTDLLSQRRAAYRLCTGTSAAFRRGRLCRCHTPQCRALHGSPRHHTKRIPREDSIHARSRSHVDALVHAFPSERHPLPYRDVLSKRRIDERLHLSFSALHSSGESVVSVLRIYQRLHFSLQSMPPP
jgi:hypothetical protein